MGQLIVKYKAVENLENFPEISQRDQKRTILDEHGETPDIPEETGAVESHDDPIART